MSGQQIAPDLQTSSDQRNLMSFRLDGRPYALPIEPIVQIIPMVTVTPVPQINDLVEGVINVRGETIPVVNMRRHLGLPQVPLRLHTPIVLVRAGEHTFGLIVDEVSDVFGLQPDRLVHPADILPKNLHGAPILRGVAYVPEGMMLMLDPDHLFSPDQAQAILQAVEYLNELESEAASEASSTDQSSGAVVEQTEGARDKPVQKAEE